ncbi:Stk1 family PASTA domain-containing Ser/Thr kinase [Agromyces aurantiacus]|uniref:non-specific serine/threonine protein kinase n=2 Tax=Agromyces aurantiacus TaxID=165814 RepID=A0ABV9R9V1_9MICO|nr:Stk1 family PASTA domain-containing Ser/Thr kinase [Agromyces aurantiacus]MBM7504586.1 serine/threonine-protein kinase [Agromyces aurantiacus]
MTTAPADPMIGRLVDGRYQVRSRIARGGMATVYLATDLRLERRVAIKIMHGHLADDNTFKTRFVQEARSAARLAHPNVVNVFDQGQDADMAYLVMEYLPGITLRDLLKDYKRLTPEQTIDILDAVLSGLAAAHKAGIVHRDLKPENVLLADDGRIKLGDFGLARAASANTATGQALLGTIAYLSPELVTRGIADARSDIYALGIMTYEMLTGEQPYVGEAPMQIAYQHANESVPAPSTRNPSVPPELDELVLWATSRDPDERPADARIMLDRLRELEPALRSTALRGASGDTMVLGTRDLAPTAETRVIAPAGRSATGAVAVADEEVEGDAVALANAASRRRRRGYWLLALVLLLTGLAAGTGWYFGAGPGSLAPVPQTAGMLPDNAAQALEEAGFQVEPAERTDPEIPKGQVSGTDPDEGALARRGSVVRMFVSLGPQMLDVPNVAGMTEDEARAALDAFTVADDSAEQFSADVEAGRVIAVVGADGAAVAAQYPERGAMTLVVSVGPVPPVEGRAVAEAQTLLEDAGLKVEFTDAQYSPDVPVDVVITADWLDDPMNPGDTVRLTVSKGPEPIAVPNVVGKTMSEAIQILEAAGFTVEKELPEIFWPIATVQEQTPAADELAAPGSSVRIVGSITL